MNHRIVQLTLMALAAMILAACGQVPTTTGVSSVEVTPESSSIAVGGTVQLTADVTADAGVDESVTWSSDPESVATVNASGLVTGVASGTADITATSIADPSVSDTVTVTVEQPAVNSVTIVEGDQTIDLDTTFDFSVNVDAIGGADTSVTWSSSDPSTASVDSNGTVTGEASGGPVTITATSVFDASVSDTVSVTVRDVVFVDASAAPGGDGSQATPWQTIPEGITDVEAGGKVVVAAGTYSASVTVDKSVALVGANADVGIDAVRGAESTVDAEVSIAGDGIDVSFNGFQFQYGVSGAASISSSGVDHSVAYEFSVFNGSFRQVLATSPASVRFESNTVTVSQTSTPGFLRVDGAAGTSVDISDNVMDFTFAGDTSPAMFLGSVAGSVANNDIAMAGIVAGEDNENINLIIAGTSGDLSVQSNMFVNSNQAIRFYNIGASLGPVAIDGNTIDTVRQGIFVETGGSVSGVSVTNNTIANVEEGIRLQQAGLSISTNTFNSASTAYVIDETGGYDLTTILDDNTYTPAATVGMAGGFAAIVQQ